MLAFEVIVNRKKIGVFGFEDWSLLNIHIDAIRSERASDSDFYQLRTGGLAVSKNENENEHVRFGEIDLQIGDEIQVRIIETDRVDPPRKRYRSGARFEENPFTEEEILAFEKKDFLRLKAKFEPNS